jgi:hypothetical protein
MTSVFDKTTKLQFRKPDEPSYVKFGTIRDKDMMYNIRSGQLKLAGFVHVLWDTHLLKFMLYLTVRTSQTYSNHPSKLL